MTRTFRFVRWHLLPDYLLLGWLPVADLGPPHSQYVTLCEWLCECPCKEPI
jgi:hypothetical protein